MTDLSELKSRDIMPDFKSHLAPLLEQLNPDEAIEEEYYLSNDSVNSIISFPDQTIYRCMCGRH